jgi:FtsH-binding integral membrane protein
MNRLLKLIENLIGAYSYLRIVASPLLIGLIAGIVVYANKQDTTGLILAICIAIAGLVIGILLANWAKRKMGTVAFVARVDASPDIDDALRKGKEEEKE